MNSEKYIGLDVHQATIVVAVMDSTGKLVMESIVETEAATILQFFAGLRGNLSVTFEEGTWSAWLYDLLNPHVEKLVVCNPRKNALLKDGNKNDRIDARKLAELLRGNFKKISSTHHPCLGMWTASSYAQLRRQTTLWARTSKNSNSTCRYWIICGSGTGPVSLPVAVPSLSGFVRCTPKRGLRSTSMPAKISSTATAAARAAT